jgi:hypothetical protein
MGRVPQLQEVGGVIESMINARARLLALTLVFLFPAACTTQTVKKVNNVKAVQAEQEVAEEALLDVGLVVFNPGIPESEELREKNNIFPQVRKAEARYLPYVLRNTLENTNQWGAVRSLPEADPAAELLVTGEILESDGFVLAVHVQAHDATGRKWLDREYEDSATQFAYRDDIDYPYDPFQDLYNKVANDLYAARQKLSAEELREIRTIANLKYAAELSPAAFGDHLRQERNGRVVINRLPASGDPMMRRVERIRESEFLFIDTLDQQYASFYREMDPSYDSWRRFSYEEVLAMADVKRSARARTLAGILGVVGGSAIAGRSNNSAVRSLGTVGALGGLTAMKQGYDTYKQAQIHEEALKELANSFDTEVKPIVVEVEGQVVKLTGSLAAQYADWRQMLREIYAAETGLPLAERQTVPELEQGRND